MSNWIKAWTYQEIALNWLNSLWWLFVSIVIYVSLSRFWQCSVRHILTVLDTDWQVSSLTLSTFFCSFFFSVLIMLRLICLVTIGCHNNLIWTKSSCNLHMTLCYICNSLLYLSVCTTDKETDESWDIFIIWQINSGLWAVGWAGLWKKRSGPIMSNFWGPFF